MKRLLRSIVHNWRSGGLRTLFGKVVMRLARVVYRLDDQLLYRCDHLEFDIARPEASFEYLHEETLFASGYFKAEAFPEEMRSRLRQSELCLGVYLDGELAHVSWMALGRLPIDVGIPDYVEEGTAGIYDMFTLPAFRRRGCQGLALRVLGNEAASRGLDAAVAVVHEGNRASRSVFERTGFQVAGRLTNRRILWWRRTRLSPVG